jgi:hypothetical protein
VKIVLDTTIVVRANEHSNAPFALLTLFTPLENEMIRERTVTGVNPWPSTPGVPAR